MSASKVLDSAVEHIRGWAAPEQEEPALHINQHSNGAEPQAEICPTCKGKKYSEDRPFGNYRIDCVTCDGTGKLRHC